MVGVAVKVTGCPLQTAPDGLAAMLTDGVTVVITTVIAFDVAGEPVAQPELDVIITVTLSPLLKVLETNVLVVAPVTSTPFTCH